MMLTTAKLGFSNAECERVCKALHRDGVCRADKPLSDAFAGLLFDALSAHSWGSVAKIKKNRLAGISQEDEVRLKPFVEAQAAERFGYLYDHLPWEKPGTATQPRCKAFDRLHEEWNAPEALEKWSIIAQGAPVTGLEMNATRFRPGHFLTPHTDGKVGTRVAAFVLSLETNWHPHWGGQTHIEDNHGETQVLTPKFNTLTLFTVPRDHFVAQVANYAPRGRIAISGWLLNETTG
ncbi:MAG: 2OG-Fe(II) oxygenase family protein [Pseudomonadota bacterium]